MNIHITSHHITYIQGHSGTRKAVCCGPHIYKVTQARIKPSMTEMLLLVTAIYVALLRPYASFVIASSRDIIPLSWSANGDKCILKYPQL